MALRQCSQIVWNTSISVGASWRAQNPSNELYSRVDGQLLGLKTASAVRTPIPPR